MYRDYWDIKVQRQQRYIRMLAHKARARSKAHWIASTSKQEGVD